MFFIGQRVVCINDKWANIPSVQGWLKLGARFPKEGVIYTIRHISDEESLVLNEIVNPMAVCRGNDGRLKESEPYFHLCKFRPLVNKQTDISIFTAMLNRKKVDA